MSKTCFQCDQAAQGHCPNCGQVPFCTMACQAKSKHLCLTLQHLSTQNKNTIESKGRIFVELPELMQEEVLSFTSLEGWIKLGLLDQRTSARIQSLMRIYLREIVVDETDAYPTHRTMTSILRLAHNLRTVHVYGLPYYLSIEDFKILATKPRLRSLKVVLKNTDALFSDKRATMEDLRPLTQLTTLGALSHRTSNYVPMISSLVHLRHLEISNPNSNDWRFIDDLPNLTELTLDYAFSDVRKRVDGLWHLTKISVMSLKHVSEATVVNLPALRELTIGSEYHHPSWITVSNLTNLEKLKLDISSYHPRSSLEVDSIKDLHLSYAHDRAPTSHGGFTTNLMRLYISAYGLMSSYRDYPFADKMPNLAEITLGEEHHLDDETDHEFTKRVFAGLKKLRLLRLENLLHLKSVKNLPTGGDVVVEIVGMPRLHREVSMLQGETFLDLEDLSDSSL